MTDATHMARALRLAKRGLYTTDPNPRVGCVLVRDGEVVGEGWHRKAGEPHAERIALAQAGERARGATAYVTLEPCSHHGRTPPCADGLIEAGVARVVAAMQDPNPLVAGRGLERLRAAGIPVEHGLLEGAARSLNPGFIKRMEQGLPHVRVKLAASLDGRTAMANGESKWITGPDARQDVQRLRARSSAIVTGIGTLLADDPSMNVRLAPEQLPGVETLDYFRQPLRVILDPALATPANAKLLGLPGRVLILYAVDASGRAQALHGDRVELRQVAGDAERLDLRAVMRLLAERQVNEVLIEAGATLAGAVIAAGLADELILYLAPHLMGADARGLMQLPGVQAMADRIDLEWSDIRRVGQDLRLTVRPKI